MGSGKEMSQVAVTIAGALSVVALAMLCQGFGFQLTWTPPKSSYTAHSPDFDKKPVVMRAALRWPTWGTATAQLQKRYYPQITGTYATWNVDLRRGALELNWLWAMGSGTSGMIALYTLIITFLPKSAIPSPFVLLVQASVAAAFLFLAGIGSIAMGACASFKFNSTSTSKAIVSVCSSAPGSTRPCPTPAKEEDLGGCIVTGFIAAGVVDLLALAAWILFCLALFSWMSETEAPPMQSPARPPPSPIPIQQQPAPGPAPVAPVQPPPPEPYPFGAVPTAPAPHEVDKPPGKDNLPYPSPPAPVPYPE